MSHFTVMVFGDNPEEQLAPFDENIDVPEYSKGPISQKDVDDFMEYYSKRNELEPDDTFEMAYARLGERWNSGRWRKVDDHFEEFSTYNPISKWDWYELGGRWTGFFKVKPGAVYFENGEPGLMTEVADEGHADRLRKRDIDIDEMGELALVPFACIVDGKWYERGDMGWWAIVINEKDADEWQDEFMKMFNALPDDTLVSLFDCHI